jgi:hypothetical protein
MSETVNALDAEVQQRNGRDDVLVLPCPKCQTKFYRTVEPTGWSYAIASKLESEVKLHLENDCEAHRND